MTCKFNFLTDPKIINQRVCLFFMSKNIAEQRQILKDLTEQYNQLREVYDGQSAKLLSVKKQQSVLQKMIPTLLEKKKELDKFLQESEKEEKDSNAKQCQQYEKREKLALDAIQLTKDSMQSLEKKCKLIELRKKVIIDNYKKKEEQIDFEIAEYKMRIKHVEAKCHEISERRAQLDDIFDIKRNEIKKHRAKDQLRALESDIVKIEKEIEQKKADINQLAEECKLLQKERDNLRKKAQETNH